MPTFTPVMTTDGVNIWALADDGIYFINSRTGEKTLYYDVPTNSGLSATIKSLAIINTNLYIIIGQNTNDVDPGLYKVSKLPLPGLSVGSSLLDCIEYVTTSETPVQMTASLDGTTLYYVTEGGGLYVYNGFNLHQNIGSTSAGTTSSLAASGGTLFIQPGFGFNSALLTRNFASNNPTLIDTGIVIEGKNIAYGMSGNLYTIFVNDTQPHGLIVYDASYNISIISLSEGEAACAVASNGGDVFVIDNAGNVYSIESMISPTTATLLVPPQLTTANSAADIVTALESYSPAEIINVAVSAGLSNTILLAFAERAATNGTAIFSSYAGTSFAGMTATISATAAASLYTKLDISGDAATKDIFISVPNAGVLTPGPPGINTSLAIDDTVNATYTFAGYPNHTLSIASGVQTFTSPSGSKVLSQGATFTLTNASGSVTYPVLSLDLTYGAGTSTSSSPVCFLGDAPVKTPSGYRRMDSLKVGDRVSTPTGTAVIQNIHCQEYTAGPSANPYVIPKGRFGATQELLISPRHKVAVNGRMVEARDLGLQQRDVGQLTYYNLGLKGANMIVAGVTVESLASLARVTISRAMFNKILTSRYGGRMTPEIAAACHINGDSVSVPILRH